MPRYYFHIDDHPSSPDADGTDLPDLRAARAEALHFAGEIMSTAEPSIISHAEPFRIRVKDDRGAEVMVLEVHDKTSAEGLAV